MVNCTNEVEDLFSKMFEVDPDKRITFSEIREHSLFSKHFPMVTPASKILYANKFKSKIVQQSGKKELTIPHVSDEDNIRASVSRIAKVDKKFPKEKEILERKKDEIDFLKENADDFLQVG